MPHSPDWILRAVGESEQAIPAPLAPWVQVVAARPRSSIGELEDGVLIEVPLASGWRVAVLPEYIQPHTLVAALSAPNSDYAMLYLTSAGAEFHRQEHPPQPGLLGWFHIRLSAPVTSERNMVANLQRALVLLQAHGVVLNCLSKHAQ